MNSFHESLLDLNINRNKSYLDLDRAGNIVGIYVCVDVGLGVWVYICAGIL